MNRLCPTHLRIAPVLVALWSVVLLGGCIEDPMAISGPDDPWDIDPEDCQQDLQWCEEAAAGLGACVNLDTDPDHCGECHRRCSAEGEGTTPICVEGTCEVGCNEAAGYADCNGEGRCVDLNANPAHCGSCGVDCRGNECIDGVCQPFPCDRESGEDQPFGGGEGTPTDPYTICAAQHLVELAEYNAFWHDHFALSRDIDLAELGDEPLAMIANFHGTFDGFGFEIQNLELIADGPHVGLFTTLGATARVERLVLRDITVENTSTDDGNRIGAVAGTNHGEIQDVHTEGSVVGHHFTGGVAGVNHGRIESVQSEATIQAHGDATGGLVGLNGHLVDGSSFQGEVIGSGTDIGGLVGRNGGTISDGAVDGSVQGPGPDDPGEGNVGGVAGRNSPEAAVLRSTVDATITSSADNTGGLVGFTVGGGSIRDSHTEVTVHGGAQGVGGLVGWAQNTEIHDSTAAGEVLANTDETDAETLLVGGLVGELHNGASIAGCDAAVAVEATHGRLVGGLVGRVRHGSSITASSAGGTVKLQAIRYGGGLAGRVGGDSQVTDAESSADVVIDPSEGFNDGIGGLVGRLDTDGSTVSDSRARGDVTTPGVADTAVGALVGRMENDTVVESSTASGDVDTEGQHVGGFVGRMFHQSTVRDSGAYGSVGGGEFVGGLVGSLEGNTGVSRCFSNGTTTGDDHVGALIGQISGADASATDVYATGDTISEVGDAAAGALVGDLGGPVNRCYATGLADSTPGVLAGTIHDDSLIGDCFALLDEGQQPPTPTLTTEEFGDQSSFAGWDFDEVWTMLATHQIDEDDFRRPRLQWELD